jgi:colicin import membrane protein
MVVDMWDSLPNNEAEPKQEQLPPSPARTEPAPPVKVTAPVLPPVKAEIEVRDKKKKAKAAAKARQAAEMKALQDYEKKQLAQQARIQAEQQRIRAEVNQAIQTQVDRYMDLIRSKIKRKMIMVADVPDTAEAIFKVTLLPDGSLLDDPVLVKSSGFPAYDDAAERAILSAEPLPVPNDVSLQKMFRELRLSIKP